MTKLPALTGKTLITALVKAGFEVLRISGLHVHELNAPNDGVSKKAQNYPDSFPGF